MNAHLRAVFHGVDRVRHAEPRPVDAPFVEGDAAEDRRLNTGLEPQELVGAERDVRLAALERLVAIVQREERVVTRKGRLRDRRALAEHGQQERYPEQQVRRDVLDVPRVEARAVRHVGIVREVAGTTVDHPARVAARAEGEIVALEQGHLEAAQGRVARDPVPLTPPPITTTSTSAARSRRSEPVDTIETRNASRWRPRSHITCRSSRDRASNLPETAAGPYRGGDGQDRRSPRPTGRRAALAALGVLGCSLFARRDPGRGTRTAPPGARK